MSFHVPISLAEPMVFVHIPKTGGISVRRALKRHIRNVKILVHRGASKKTLLERVGRMHLNTDPTVHAVIREPTERLISAYWYLKNGGQRHTSKDARDATRVLGDYEDFEDFVLRGLQNVYMSQVHLKPQCFWLRTRKKRKKEKKWELYPYLKLFKYEDMNKTITSYLEEMVNISLVLAPTNITINKPKTEVTSEAREVINKVYAQDLALWKSL